MRFNTCFFNAIMAGDPKIVTDSEGNSFAQFKIITINGYRPDKKRLETKAFYYPSVFTREPRIIEAVKESHKGDLVQIKGAITTGFINRKPTCPHCNEKNIFPGIFTYISPTSFLIMKKAAALDNDGIFDNNLACKLLEQCKETSNIVSVMGVICHEPQHNKTDIKGPARLSSYQLALKRTFRLYGSLEDATCDFPWVKSYGKNSKYAELYLKKGTYVLIDGYFRAKDIKRRSICQHCGEEFEWHTYSGEIVPYNTEFLKNSKTEEEKMEYVPRTFVETEDTFDYSQDVATEEEKKEASKFIDKFTTAKDLKTEEQTENDEE